MEKLILAPSQPAPVQNRLLTSLPPEVLSALMPKLQPVPLTVRRVLLGSESLIDWVYFPISGMISLVSILNDGMRAEIGIVGNEGMLGVSLLAGVDTMFGEANVQLPGSAWRMSAADLGREIASDGPFRSILLKYNEALTAQISQTAACNGNHEIVSRLVRWLLMAHDRADGDELALTQDFMAMMLGVHRPSVTISAGILQRANLISHSKNGRIKILDRIGLEAAACECYNTVGRRYTAILGPNF